MVKKLRLLQCLLLSVVILGAEVKKADAFFLLPPMPWDIEVDIPGNANKVVSNLKAYYRQLQTIKSELNSQKLEVLKKDRFLLLYPKNLKAKAVKIKPRARENYKTMPNWASAKAALMKKKISMLSIRCFSPILPKATIRTIIRR